MLAYCYRCIVNLARTIDHTLLKPEATEADIRRLVSEAIEHRFMTVCVNGQWIPLVAGLLHTAGVTDAQKSDWPFLPCAVVGFPLGANRSHVKAWETAIAVKEGA